MRKAETPSHMFKVRLLWVVFIYLFVPTMQNLYADGKYFPAEAFKTPPDIPAQRAILTYRDGIERLTIESALNGQGQEFGWIIPLPSKPTEFKKSSPGLIKSLSLTLQPEIVHDLWVSVSPVCAITFIITLACLMSITETPKKRVNRFLLLLLITLLCFCFLMMPVMSAGRKAGIKTSDTSGIKVHGIHEIGSYELAILEADNAEALDNWLSSNGFTGLTDKDGAVVSDYIKDGWFFVAAKLRREGDGYSLPHPLTMAFPSKVPIYPIRLTSTLGDNLYLELFVITEKQANCSKLTLEVSDEYSFFEELRGLNLYHETDISGFKGKTYSQDIGHPDAKEHLWDGCIISKLSGTLTPEDMAEDIILELESSKPYQRCYFSRLGACMTAFFSSLGAWSLVLLVLTTVFGSKGKKGDKSKALLRITVFALLVSLLVGGIVYAILPQVEVNTVDTIILLRYDSWIFYEGLDIAEKYDYFIDRSVDETVQLVDDYFTSESTRKNIYTGEKIKREDSPGNYTIFKDERGIILRGYSREGFPHDCILTLRPEDNEE